MAPLTDLPRTIVRRGLQSLRLPLDVAEAIARRAGADVDETWLPAVAYAGFEADAKRLLGSLLRDDELLEDGRRQRLRAAKLRQAMHLQAVADGTRDRADTRLEQRREAAARQRRAITEAATEAEHAVESETARARTKVERQAAQRRRAEAAVEAEREEVVEKVEREARRRTLAEEAAALEKERQAVEAKGRARALAEAEHELKERRRQEG